MIRVQKEGVLFYKTTLEFELEGVLNPAAIKDGNKVHIFYRAVGKSNYSSIGYCLLEGPLTVAQRAEQPLLIPEFDYESHGIEDPRIVQIEDIYYLTYTAYDGVNALGALALSADLKTFAKQGVITPQISFENFRTKVESTSVMSQQYIHFNEHIVTKERDGDAILLWDKNLLFFPRKINGLFYFLHRIKPEIQMVAVERLELLNEEFWKDYFTHLDEWIVLSPKYTHEESYIGGGCPPIETEIGWLIIYHGVRTSLNGNVYSACAALLDLNNPQEEIARLPYPLFYPEENWELEGEVNNVCFPTGTALFDDTLYIYYGAADEQIATASLNLPELLNELMLNKTDNETRNDR